MSKTQFRFDKKWLTYILNRIDELDKTAKLINERLDNIDKRLDKLGRKE